MFFALEIKKLIRFFIFYTILDVNCTRFTECDDCVKNGCNYVWNTAACVSEDGIPLDSTFTPAYAPEFCPNPSTPTAIPENEGSFYVIGFWFLFSVIIVLLSRSLKNIPSLFNFLIDLNMIFL